jgi:hypothetical protein
MKPEMQRIASFPMKMREKMRPIPPTTACHVERDAMRPVSAAHGRTEGSA